MKKHIFISGRVQGVGFRHFTRKNAESLGVTGWVKNLSDGRVEAVFQGDEEQVDKLIQKCKKGPKSSYVKDIEVNKETGDKDYDEFSVEF